MAKKQSNSDAFDAAFDSLFLGSPMPFYLHYPMGATASSLSLIR